jgi:hypothetical protein
MRVSLIGATGNAYAPARPETRIPPGNARPRRSTTKVFSRAAQLRPLARGSPRAICCGARFEFEAHNGYGNG